MPAILELLAAHGAGADSGGEPAIQDLDGLLVDAEDDGAGRRPQVEVADALDLLAEVGVGAVEPLANAVGAKAFGGEDALDGRAAEGDAGRPGQRLREPVSRPQALERQTAVALARAGELDDLAAGQEIDARRSARTRRIVQRRKAGRRLPTSTPLAHEAVTATHERRDPGWAVIGSEVQDDASADDEAEGRSGPRDHAAEISTVTAADAKRSRGGTRHASSTPRVADLFPSTRTELLVSCTRLLPHQSSGRFRSGGRPVALRRREAHVDRVEERVVACCKRALFEESRPLPWRGARRSSSSRAPSCPSAARARRRRSDPSSPRRRSRPFPSLAWPPRPSARVVMRRTSPRACRGGSSR